MLTRLHSFFHESVVVWVLEDGSLVVSIVVAALIMLALLHITVSRFHNRLIAISQKKDFVHLQRIQTLTQVVQDVFRIIIVILASIMILAELGVDIKPLLAAAGIGGIAFGLGAQSLVKDLISGFFLLLENQLQVGDIVEIGGKSGCIEEIRLRTIRLRDYAGNVHIIPNGTINNVTNMTRGFSYTVWNIGVG